MCARTRIWIKVAEGGAVGVAVGAGESPDVMSWLLSPGFDNQ